VEGKAGERASAETDFQSIGKNKMISEIDIRAVKSSIKMLIEFRRKAQERLDIDECIRLTNEGMKLFHLLPEEERIKL